MAIITISRGTKSLGEELAKRLSRRLGYECISREVIRECARKYNIMEDDLFERLQSPPNFWQKFATDHKRYYIFIQCALIDAVKQDNVIYHGYAGQLFLQGVQHVLKIRLDAPMDRRVAAVMTEQGLTAEKARSYVENIDEQRRRWVKYAYGADWQDPKLYDVSFYIDHMTLDTICELVAQAIDREEFETTETSMRRLQNLSLECEVKAAFASDDRLWQLPVTVSANGGVVELKGTIKNKKQREMLVGLAMKVKGVEDCNVHMLLLSDSLSKGIHGYK